MTPTVKSFQFLILLFTTGIGYAPLHAGETSADARVIMEKLSVARQAELLRLICDADQVVIRKGVPQCRTCPAGFSGNEPGSLRITNAISGNFTRGDGKEILVDVEGCLPQAESGGGSVLLRESGARWTRTAFLPGVRTNECVRFRYLQQTTALACSMSSLQQGIQRGRLVWLALHSDKPVQTDLLTWYDNSRSDARHLVSVFPHRFAKLDFNGDGRFDLQVSIRVRDEPVPDKYSSYIVAIESGHSFKAGESVSMIFLRDGNSMVLSPESEDSKARIDTLIRQTEER